MIETICVNCRQRYPLGQDHVCPKPVAKKSTEAAKPGSATKRVGTPAEGLASALSPREPVELMQIVTPEEVPVERLTPKPKYKDRHKPGYQAQKQREYRARKKAAK